jgi:hypothetical protein
MLHGCVYFRYSAIHMYSSYLGLAREVGQTGQPTSKAYYHASAIRVVSSVIMVYLIARKCTLYRNDSSVLYSSLAEPLLGWHGTGGCPDL